MGKSAPGFRWKKLLICSKILSRSVAEKAVINEPLPYFRSQCKFVTLQTLRMCSLQIKSQIPHYLTISVSRHDYQGKNEVPNLHSTAHHSQLTCSHMPPRVYTSAINASSSSMASDQFCLPALDASASLQRLM